MNSDDNYTVNIIRQASGRFDRRHIVGPIDWPHFDLLWIHQGSVILQIGDEPNRLTLQAPTGILICPNTYFKGRAIDQFALASICHFSATFPIKQHQTHFLPNKQDELHLQNLVQLSFNYNNRKTPELIRHRLLQTIIDNFLVEDIGFDSDIDGRVEQAWLHALQHLDKIRSLTDVANVIDLSESSFRALHSNMSPTSAGRYLQNMRLDKAEQLLMTTGDKIVEIASAVGYSHAESFSSAFTKSRGLSPTKYRKSGKIFA